MSFVPVLVLNEPNLNLPDSFPQAIYGAEALDATPEQLFSALQRTAHLPHAEVAQ